MVSQLRKALDDATYDENFWWGEAIRNVIAVAEDRTQKPADSRDYGTGD